MSFSMRGSFSAGCVVGNVPGRVVCAMQTPAAAKNRKQKQLNRRAMELFLRLVPVIQEPL